jgi:aminoglycoside phosphotransferase (APT) family kinase protein
MSPNPSDDRRLREALHRLPGMAGARVVEQLADGPTNSSYRVQQGDEMYVLRLDNPGAAELGLRRDNDRLVCEEMAAAGLGAPFLHFDPESGSCLRRFVPGRCLQPADLREPGTLSALGRVLRRLHDLPPVGAEFAPLAAARRYASQLNTPASAMLLEQAEATADILSDFERRPALCHNDLLAENILDTGAGELLLIDWEYAGVGDPWFDLAVVVAHHGLPGEAAAHLLAAYLDGPVPDRERVHLALQCNFYRCLLVLWNRRVAAGNGAPGDSASDP